MCKCLIANPPLDCQGNPTQCRGYTCTCPGRHRFATQLVSHPKRSFWWGSFSCPALLLHGKSSIYLSCIQIILIWPQFIPAHAAGRPLPAPFYEWVSFSRSLLDPMDYPTTDLGLLIARFVDLSAYIRAEPPKGKRISAVHQLLELDAAFEDWEAGLTSVWPYRTESARHLPPAAVFNGEYHVYYDMWTARMWMHYRWARILTNQTIVDLADQQPRSSPPLLLAAQYQRCLNIIRQQARETLVSIPSHWRHPLLDKQKSTMPVEKSGGAGSGAAGIPVVLFQLKVAACAPGLPAAYWDWAYGVMECIWGDLGMVHAKNMMDGMVAERDARYQFRTESSSSPPEQRMTSL